ncbi:Sm1 protein [Choiromyces venosus 120613-1]|uniref:Sm1 protein n=1 Tax=Choiromyces venosus 120613-1 TaxID=1336337 RepID=A0A3N4J8A4_9PEZI|nr:Sm1 protein [Choiromyces venosus 120613-1]
MYYPKPLLLALMTLAASTVLAEEVHSTASFDNVYDLPDLPTLDLACSNGVAGLSSTLGLDRISQVPHYPLVGVIEKVEGWGSLSCGKCFRVMNQQSGQNINIIAVDHADMGLVLSLAALDQLTGGQGQVLGRVDVRYEEIGRWECGL